MSTLSIVLIVLFLILFALWLISRVVLSVPNLSQYDEINVPLFESHPDEPAARQAVIASLDELRSSMKKTRSIKKALVIGREYADNLSNDLQTESRIVTVNQDGIDAEWIIAPNADTKRRIVYFHGGAFIVGSARGHRNITDKLAKLANAAVLSVNYRMSPEHSRPDGIQDAQNAYQWILSNGPDGEQALDYLLVGGDSAGGNLALMISTWAKSTARQADGVITFSPLTDFGLTAPTIRSNQATDPILGEGLGILSKLPLAMRNWISLLVTKINPSSPLASPLLGDLTNLPPTLVLASSSEMLLGDCIRYTNMANSAGSDVRLKIWKNQIHDWPLFLTEGDVAADAWLKVDDFLKSLDT